MSRSKFGLSEKLDLINEFDKTVVSVSAFTKINGITRSTLRRWLTLFERDGVDGLREKTKNDTYPEELKLKVVHDFLDGKDTMEGLVNKYGLRSVFQVYDWVFKYNNGKSLARHNPSRKQDSIMSRKTTFEERIEIVEYVTKNNHSYSEAAKHFSVTYQQVRSWVLKSKKDGYEALLDGRGHRKAKKDLTDLDKANLKIRQLESQLEDQKIIEAFVKKLKELQHRG
ncbi:helix-turn-helix domain-containing protein [Companilactobacillus allii]|uniref:Transposase n=1 Tax=Companilactobacillus allii TaxID=1847728 RepID=A0A1P8Q5T0_9LACO|nr:helix-turn-helix domain-containing protein [Companilactobacillus allii]APX73216.1 transposase [Companilactobacillus allii]USQ68026.1 helix-turn-helix domain-containing protein [Companilactobacillus allii]